MWQLSWLLFIEQRYLQEHVTIDWTLAVNPKRYAVNIDWRRDDVDWKSKPKVEKRAKLHAAIVKFVSLWAKLMSILKWYRGSDWNVFFDIVMQTQQQIQKGPVSLF